MAEFPELEPATRSYTLGAFPITEESSASAGSVRFRHGLAATNAELSLGFEYLTEAQASLLRVHFQGQAGSFLGFQLPPIVWKGHTFTENIFSIGAQWRYAQVPEETHLSGGLVNVSISLVSDGINPDSVFLPLALSIQAGAASGA